MERQYVGIDLHRRRSLIVRMNAAGEVLDEVRIENDPLQLMDEIAKAGPSPEVALEATYGWYRAADVLAECGARVHLAHPLAIKAFENRRVKNDRIDATLLAELLRMGRLPEGRIAPRETRELRELVRYRHKLVDAAIRERGSNKLACVFCPAARRFVPETEYIRIQDAGEDPKWRS